MADIHYMTQEGLEKLRKDLSDAIARRPEISAAIAEAREKGDLSENAEYDAAREAQGLLELKIVRLKDLIANAKVIDESQVGTDKVQLMNKVKVRNLSNDAVMEFMIVGRQVIYARKAGRHDADRKGAARSFKGRNRRAHAPSRIIKFKILDITLSPAKRQRFYKIARKIPLSKSRKTTLSMLDISPLAKDIPWLSKQVEEDYIFHLGRRRTRTLGVCPQVRLRSRLSFPASASVSVCWAWRCPTPTFIWFPCRE